MADNYIDAFDMATNQFFENCRRVEIADLYSDQINVILDHLAREGSITRGEADKITDLMNDMAAASENQRFMDGVRYGVQFMAAATRGIETGDEARNLNFKYLMENRKRWPQDEKTEAAHE